MTKIKILTKIHCQVIERERRSICKCLQTWTAPPKLTFLLSSRQTFHMVFGNCAKNQAKPIDKYLLGLKSTARRISRESEDFCSKTIFLPDCKIGGKGCRLQKEIDKSGQFEPLLFAKYLTNNSLARSSLSSIWSWQSAKISPEQGKKKRQRRLHDDSSPPNLTSALVKVTSSQCLRKVLTPSSGYQLLALSQPQVHFEEKGFPRTRLHR